MKLKNILEFPITHTYAHAPVSSYIDLGTRLSLSSTPYNPLRRPTKSD